MRIDKIIILFGLLLMTILQPLQAKIYSADPFYNRIAPETRQAGVNYLIVKRLDLYHYLNDLELNDDLSSKIYDAYIKSLDSNRLLFTQSEIDKFEKFRNLVDEALKYADLKPAFNIFNVYLNRRVDRLIYMLNFLDNKFDKFNFNQLESWEIDREKANWSKDLDELKDNWRKALKNNVLELKLEGESDKEIKEKLIKRFETQLNRLKQTKTEDAFRVYMNAFTETYDPHTQYFSPRASENFNIQMKLSLEGIGAILLEEEGYTKIKRIIPGGPADKAGNLRAGDRIVGVAQGEKELVDVYGWRLDDVVQLIRGEKGSIVRLRIIPRDALSESKTQVIQVVRDKVKLEEQAARKKILTIKQAEKNYKIGVIDLPSFYSDFQAAQENESDFRSTTRDVKRLLSELKKENIDGLILDLRNNGGGSLTEVNHLLGLFIGEGPTVQVKGTDDETMSLKNDTNNILYDGSLLVMVNRLSASASEIFAGAIQDYGRGLVVGGQTFGKGTVQTLQPLRHGQLKLTSAKFYRVSGDSTQNHGIIPDILFPPIVDADDIGESSLPNALLWDRIKPVKHRSFENFSQILPSLKLKHQTRISKNPDFIYMDKLMRYFKQLKKRQTVSLNINERKLENEKIEQQKLVIENERKISKKMAPYQSVEDMQKQLEKKAEEAESKAHPEDNSESLAYLNEGAEILVDWLLLQKNQQVAIEHQ